MDLTQIRLSAEADTPLYKQLAAEIAALIESSAVAPGEKLPPTRELARQLGLNRTTVSAAYGLLEQSGRLDGQVGRGSFVATPAKPEVAPVSSGAAAAVPKDWDSILPAVESSWKSAPQNIEISFASSRPAREEFPMAEFRRLSKEVIDSPDAVEILQLGSSRGYPPLRRYLLDRAVAAGIARPTDDLIVTNGCQQAFDLIARVFASGDRQVAGSLDNKIDRPVVLEDPVYHGALKVFSRTGSEVIGVPVGPAGIDIENLEQVLARRRPRLLIVTPSFQNPTGITMPLERRMQVVSLAERFGCVLVENDIYSELRYTGNALPTLKELDAGGNVILLRSYSKVAFPGLRVGWVVAPRPVITRLAEAKEISDLHSDQLAQAVLLRFAESGELDRHLARSCEAGRERLAAALDACTRFLPPGSRFTSPQGGMNLWIQLPDPLTADGVLRRSEERGVTFLPGRHFSISRTHAAALRISFGGLPPKQIVRGLRTLGDAALSELDALSANPDFEPAAALV